MDLKRSRLARPGRVDDRLGVDRLGVHAVVVVTTVDLVVDSIFVAFVALENGSHVVDNGTTWRRRPGARAARDGGLGA